MDPNHPVNKALADAKDPDRPSAPLSPRLEDVQQSLGHWLADVTPGFESALAEIGVADWKDGTRENVIEHAMMNAVDLFAAGEHESLLHAQSVDLARASAKLLGDYLIARSLQLRAEGSPR